LPLWNTQASDELTAFMNGPVRNLLGIIPPEVIWVESKLSIELSYMNMIMFIYHAVIISETSNKSKPGGSAFQTTFLISMPGRLWRSVTWNI